MRGSWARVLERVTRLDDGRVLPLPRAGNFAQPLVASFERIKAAVASALRSDPDAITARGRPRALFVQLALAVGQPRRSDLAAACGVTLQAIRRAARNPDRAGLRCALRCLQDDRLRVHDVSPPGRNVASARVRAA
jgi:hypothetical protein